MPRFLSNIPEEDVEKIKRLYPNILVGDPEADNYSEVLTTVEELKEEGLVGLYSQNPDEIVARNALQ